MKHKSLFRRMVNLGLQLLFFVVAFNLVSYFRELSLLDTSGNLSAPAFNLMDTDHNPVNLQQLRGKPTLIYFWAPWCSICKLSLPNLEQFYQDNQSSINIVSIALSYQSNGEVVEFIGDNQLTFPTLFGTTQTSSDYKITGFPTYYLLNSEGNIVSSSMGYSTELGMVLRSLDL